jgi:hypothetical protein
MASLVYNLKRSCFYFKEIMEFLAETLMDEGGTTFFSKMDINFVVGVLEGKCQAHFTLGVRDKKARGQL